MPRAAPLPELLCMGSYTAMMHLQRLLLTLGLILLATVAGAQERTQKPPLHAREWLAITGKPQYLLYGLLCGYGCAWIGHFVFEKNKPASFKRPLYSFMGDWVMYKDMWTGKIKF